MTFGKDTQNLLTLSQKNTPVKKPDKISSSSIKQRKVAISAQSPAKTKKSEKFERYSPNSHLTVDLRNIASLESAEEPVIPSTAILMPPVQPIITTMSPPIMRQADFKPA